MAGILEDIDRRILEAKAKAQERKMREAQEKAQKEAARLAAVRRKNDSHHILW